MKWGVWFYSAGRVRKGLQCRKRGGIRVQEERGTRVYSAGRGRKGLQCRKREEGFTMQEEGGKGLQCRKRGEGFTMQEEGGRVYCAQCAGRRGMGRADAISQKSENDHHA